MFFVGLALILAIWFVGSLARGKDFRTYFPAEMLALFFVISLAIFALGLMIDPVAPAAWAFSLFGFLTIGVALSLLVAAWRRNARENSEAGRRPTHEVGVVAKDQAYMKTFAVLTAVTVFVALISRLIG